ncbi:hypothetical protein CTheo_4982 [Ceratobasidium theobromae]|uniref:Wax synthase domain-containing protein n=1 Tax=Ceratobasidium theobromae TaxID=1582974 RepID=A0A5N5QJ89_9AGAM|nr:hypothetical protein CTheo_4982 [Ceratobasidium theobromae]
MGAGGCTFAMMIISMSTLGQPLKRKSESECPRSSLFSLKQLFDAIDFSLDIRGLHWDLGHGCYLPTETRDTSTLFNFEVDTLFMALKHALAFAAFYFLISQVGSVSSISGGTIFVWTRVPSPLGDISIPPFLTACFVTSLAGLEIYHLLMALHLSITFLLAPFYENPAQSWPLLFGNPLDATSVYDFWTHRWHSTLRHGFLSTGGKLGWMIGGKVGLVFGVFLISGLLHDFAVWCMGQGTDFSRVTAYFVLQGIIVILERSFDVDVWIDTTDTNSRRISLGASITRHKKEGRVVRENSLVDNGLGRLWTVFWVVVPATLAVDAMTRRGFLSIPFEINPVRRALGF